MDSVREWGVVDDYCEAIWLSLQQEVPEDYIIGVGRGKSIREWITMVFKEANINVTFTGTGIEEVGKDDNGKVLVRVNPKFFRPNDAKVLVSNPKKIYEKTGWKPKYDEINFIKELLEEEE